MLNLPTNGIRTSTNHHNCDVRIVCDWIEASLLFTEQEVSMNDIVDSLIREHVYQDQDYAYEYVENIWTEIRRRIASIGQGFPGKLLKKRFVRTSEWQEAPAYSFCLLLSLKESYENWAEECLTDPIVQGELFENLTKEALEKVFKGWTIYKTGWAQSGITNFNDMVDKVVELLHEEKLNYDEWISKSPKDLGLDLLIFKPFPDRRVGIPLFLMQCASGSNWKDKLHTPDINVWKKVINFASTPKKAFVVPFALLDDEFKRRCVIVDGMLIDRHRLLFASSSNDVKLSDELKDQIIQWADPKIQELLKKLY